MSTNKGIVFQKGVDMVLLRQLAKTAKIRKCIFGRIPFYRHILIFFILQGCQCLHFLLRSDVKINHRCLNWRVSKQEWNLHDIHSIFKPVGRFCVAELMCMKIQGHILTFFVCRGGIFPQDFVYRLLRKLGISAMDWWIKQISECVGLNKATDHNHYRIDTDTISTPFCKISPEISGLLCKVRMCF